MIPNKKRLMKPISTKCTFCETKTEPNYKVWQALSPLMTSRGKILGRTRTGVCQKHQRRMTIAIERARHLGRVPFVSVIS